MIESWDMDISQSVLEIAPKIQAWEESPGNLLAYALGWSNIESIATVSGGGHLSKGIIGSQPAFVFASSRNENEFSNIAASFAYHTSIQWGVVITDRSATIFNSHWIYNGDWFNLPSVSWENPLDHIDLFQSITPQALTSGKIERTATRYRRPDRLLTPVDDALVDRLDYWRDEALRFTTESQDIDEKLQTLFAQLFVLRVVEDRNLAPSIPRLSGSNGRDTLNRIFGEAQIHVQSELFETLVHNSFPDFILEGIIHDLYVPLNMPFTKYNFSWIKPSVLGSAYEKYLSTRLVSIPSQSRQMRLFDEQQRDVKRVSIRKKTGVYYTPGYLVDYLTHTAVNRFYEAHAEEDIPRVADFSCGSGSFLTSALDTLIRRMKRHDPNVNWARTIVEQRRIVGIDSDLRAVSLARLSLWLRFAEEPNPLPLPALQETIIHADSLSRDAFVELPSNYDIILGNPPFIATGKYVSRQELASRFQTATGRFDFSYLFVELAIQKLNENGIVAMVIPNRILLNRDARVIRRLLVDQTSLLSIVNFGSVEVFSNTSAYIATIIARKTSPPAERVRTINVKELPENFAGAMLDWVDQETRVIKDDYVHAYSALQPKSGDGWLLLSSDDRLARTVLEDVGEPLSTIAGIYQGIKTGLNDLFVIRIITQSHRGLVEVENGWGETFIIEPNLLRPVVYGSSVQRYERLEPTKYLLYPYKVGNLYPEEVLKTSFPETYSYLRFYYDYLAARKSLGTQRWYELVRSRDEVWLTSKKLLIRDLATVPSFALDELGELFILSGTAVVPNDETILLPLLGYLNSKVVAWYLKQTTSTFRAGFQKFEPRHLQQIPIPQFVIDGDSQLTEYVDNVLQGQIDEDVIDEYIIDKLGLEHADL